MTVTTGRSKRLSSNFNVSGPSKQPRHGYDTPSPHFSSVHPHQPRAAAGRGKRVVIDLCDSSSESSSEDRSEAQGMLDAAVTLHDMSFGELPPLTEQDKEFMKSVMEELFSDAEGCKSPPKRQSPPAKKPRTRSFVALGALKPPPPGVRGKSAERVYRVLLARRELVPARWKHVREHVPRLQPRVQRRVPPSPPSTSSSVEESSEHDADDVTECLSDLELSAVAAESDTEAAVDEQEREELLEFVRNLPSARISKRQQRLARASLMTWRFECA